MFQATEQIYEAFQNADLKCTIHENENSSYIEAGVVMKLSRFDMLFISRDDDNDVAVRVFHFVSFKEDKFVDVLQLANHFNTKYRYMKFVVETDGTVSMEYDFPVCCEDPGAAAVELLARFLKVADEIYAEFMKIIWA